MHSWHPRQDEWAFARLVELTLGSPCWRLDAGWDLEKFEQGYVSAAADFSAAEGGKAVAVGQKMWVVLGTKK